MGQGIETNTHPISAFGSFKGRLLVFSLTISLVPIALITTIYYLNARNAAKKQTLDMLAAVAESRRSHILEFMEAKKGRATDFSSDGFILDSLEDLNARDLEADLAVKDLSHHLLVNKQSLDTWLVAIAVANKDGRVVVSTNETLIGKEVYELGQAVYALNTSNNKTRVGQPYYSPYLNTNCIPFIAPLTSRTGTTMLGTIINVYDLAALDSITTIRTGLGETGEVYLVNRDGMALTELRFKETKPLRLRIDTMPVHKALKDGEGMTAIYPDYRGVPVVGTSVVIPEYNWILLAEIDKAEAFAQLKYLGLVALIVGGVSAAVVASVGTLFTLSTARPILLLSDVVKRFAQGHLKERANIARRDEIGSLAESFNTMAKELARTIDKYVQAVEGLRKQQDRLNKLTSELSASNKELQAFCYSVSHDLRAPLRGIDGFSKAMEEDYTDKLDAQGKDYLRRIRVASQRMAQLIDDLLKLSRVTRSEMHRETVNLTATAQAIALEFQKRQPNRQVTFIVAEGLTANGDRSLLSIALENLLDNAWKFTQKSPHARIEFGSTLRDGKQVYFVSDNGAGFDNAYTHKLFGAFQRLHSVNEFPGTGIGLATVQRIIHRHGGHIWAEGAVEKGATFYFTLQQI
jgi:signal transduction histidine kinase